MWPQGRLAGGSEKWRLWGSGSVFPLDGVASGWQFPLREASAFSQGSLLNVKCFFPSSSNLSHSSSIHTYGGNSTAAATLQFCTPDLSPLIHILAVKTLVNEPSLKYPYLNVPSAFFGILTDSKSSGLFFFFKVFIRFWSVVKLSLGNIMRILSCRLRTASNKKPIKGLRRRCYAKFVLKLTHWLAKTWFLGWHQELERLLSSLLYGRAKCFQIWQK